jgi:hypothetical protein
MSSALNSEIKNLTIFKFNDRKNLITDMSTLVSCISRQVLLNFVVLNKFN